MAVDGLALAHVAAAVAGASSGRTPLSNEDLDPVKATEPGMT